MEHDNPPDRLQLSEQTVKLDPQDDVVVAKRDLSQGTVLIGTDAGEARELSLEVLVPSGHKLALRAISAGEPVHRYGQVIGFAKQDIQPGAHVHKHNLGMGNLTLDYAFGADARPVELVPESNRRTFYGYRRANGQVGTRNYIAVVSTVSCSAYAARAIARYFTPERLAAYGNVDGVMAVTHLSGCSYVPDGPVYTLLQRSLAGMVRHANVAASVIVGLGCEVNQLDALIENYDLAVGTGKPLHAMVIQEMGGGRKTVQAGIETIEALLPQVNAVERRPQPISELMIALQCGGSDGWSGVTANPLVGMVSDEVVRQGGTVVLAETPEIYGAEHLLTRRAITRAVGEKVVDKVHWWEAHTHKHGAEIDNNPTPGNIAGGLTTIYEKALGAVTKAGSTSLMGVFDYAEPVTTRGFTFMDTPGNDPVSVTGQIAGGCNMVLFTTGRGSVVGFQPAPSIKIASNSSMYQRLQDDMDFDAGRVLADGDIQALTSELLDVVVAVASGRPSKSEEWGSGEEVFSPWQLGELV